MVFTVRRRKEKHANKTLRSSLKSATAVLLATAILSSPLSLPGVNAYFTDRISFGSGQSFRDGSGSAASLTLFFDVHRFTDLRLGLDLIPEDDVLTAAVNLPGGSGFDAADICRNSLELTYSGEASLPVVPLHMDRQGKKITAVFAWGEIERLMGPDDNDPEFELSGKGAGAGRSGAGERFIFSGRGRITDLSHYFEPAEESLQIPEPEGEGTDNKSEAEDKKPDQEAESQIPAEALEPGVEDQDREEGGAETEMDKEGPAESDEKEASPAEKEVEETEAEPGRNDLDTSSPGEEEEDLPRLGSAGEGPGKKNEPADEENAGREDENESDNKDLPGDERSEPGKDNGSHEF